MIALSDLTRRGRRRAFVLLTAGVVGVTVPTWVPRLLATLPAFHVSEVRVAGTRYAPPDEIKALAGIEPDASVWDDPSAWESRVRSHSLIREATVRRRGLRAVEIVVVEKRAVALVATPELRPVDPDGMVLDLDPVAARLDLPVIRGVAELAQGRVTDPEIRKMAALLDRLERVQPDFVSVVSEVSRAPNGGYRFALLPGAEAAVVLLPEEDPAGALVKVSLALGQIEDEIVARADARFMRQVVLTRAEGR